MIKQRVDKVLSDWKTCDKLLSELKCDNEGIFIHLIRPSFMCSDKLYTHHVTELITRCNNGESISPATNAEVLSFMGYVNETVSLPGNEAIVSMRYLFSDIFGDSDIITELNEAVSNYYDPQSKILIETLKKKLTNKNRFL